jgi:putative FmdB family regulatory protein
MPVYEYLCAECGEVFTLIRPMVESRQPADCPTCGVSAPRAFVSAPRLNTMRADLRKAHQTNEKSAHEPRVSRGHRCGPSCSHHGPKPAQPPVKQQAGKRPWMLGH